MDFGFCFLRECDSQRWSCVPFVLIIRAPRGGRKSTRTQTRNESFGLEKWYRCFYAMRFDIDQSRDGLARHFLRALFSSRCKIQESCLFWASFKGERRFVSFLDFVSVSLHICALCARFSPSFCELTRTFSVTQTHSVTFIPSKYIYNHGDGEDERGVPSRYEQNRFFFPSQS